MIGIEFHLNSTVVAFYRWWDEWNNRKIIGRNYSQQWLVAHNIHSHHCILFDHLSLGSRPCGVSSAYYFAWGSSCAYGLFRSCWIWAHSWNQSKHQYCMDASIYHAVSFILANAEDLKHLSNSSFSCALESGLGVDDMYIVMLALKKQKGYNLSSFLAAMEEVLVPVTMTSMVNAGMFAIMNVNVSMSGNSFLVGNTSLTNLGNCILGFRISLLFI
jgi:hypothetical protein